MRLEKKDIIIQSRKAVKSHLEADGWQILFFNTTREYPVDVRAVKGYDKIVGHISYRSKDWRDRDEISKRLNELKTEAEKTLAYPFSIEVSIDNKGTVQDIVYNQLM